MGVTVTVRQYSSLKSWPNNGMDHAWNLYSQRSKLVKPTYVTRQYPGEGGAIPRSRTEWIPSSIMLFPFSVAAAYLALDLAFLVRHGSTRLHEPYSSLTVINPRNISAKHPTLTLKIFFRSIYYVSFNKMTSNTGQTQGSEPYRGPRVSISGPRGRIAKSSHH